MKKRLDILTTEQGIFPSREKAKASIMAGLVYVDGQRCDKPGTPVPETAQIAVKEDLCPYVSRGGLKLEKALKTWDFALEGAKAVDIGASTGGFTDCMLMNGAAKVYCIDVGYGQLDWKLRNDPRVTVMERTNARYLEPSQFPDRPSVTVMDVSFISVRLILPVAAGIMGDNGVFYTLIKPQFEAGRSKVGKNGVVRDPDTHKAVLSDILAFVEKMGWQITALDFSPITGPKGNIEFLAEIRKKCTSHSGITDGRIDAVVAEAHDKMFRS